MLKFTGDFSKKSLTLLKDSLSSNYEKNKDDLLNLLRDKAVYDKQIDERNDCITSVTFVEQIRLPLYEDADNNTIIMFVGICPLWKLGNPVFPNSENAELKTPDNFFVNCYLHAEIVVNYCSYGSFEVEIPAELGMLFDIDKEGYTCKFDVEAKVTHFLERINSGVDEVLTRVDAKHKLGNLYK